MAAAWSTASPLFSAPDEPAHTIKAVAAARFRFTGESVVGQGKTDQCVVDVAGPPSGPITCTYYVVPRIFAAAVRLPVCYKFHPEIPANCAVPFSGPTRDARVASTAASNPPLYYFVVGLPSLLIQ